MNTPSDGSAVMTRRKMIQVAGFGLIAAGAGSPSLFGAGTEPRAFRFIVINDLHCRDERCITWFQKFVENMRPHNADFCLINGDVSDDGSAAQLNGIKHLFSGLGIPLYATLGNHDYAIGNDHTPFNQVFPNSLNYHFDHGGWQFVGLDTTDGRKVIFTEVQQSTLAWLDKNMPTLDKQKPTVLCTHFPMGQAVLCRPLNADDVLKRFDGYNLRAVFNGHWHGYAERQFEHANVTNSRCASWWRTNNDGSPDKGYHVCETTPDGSVKHQFCVVT
jgi:3',5'-cyclic AMP phosphodiesterase CpdA